MLIANLWKLCMVVLLYCLLTFLIFIYFLYYYLLSSNLYWQIKIIISYWVYKLGCHVLSLTFSVTRLVWFDSCSCGHTWSRHSALKWAAAVGIQPVGIRPGRYWARRGGRHSARSAFRPPPLSQTPAKGEEGGWHSQLLQCVVDLDRLSKYAD